MREININVRTAEERASLALFYSNKKRVISAVFVFLFSSTKFTWSRAGVIVKNVES